MLSFSASGATARQLTTAQMYSSVPEHILNQQQAHRAEFSQMRHTTFTETRTRTSYLLP